MGLEPELEGNIAMLEGKLEEIVRHRIQGRTDQRTAGPWHTEAMKDVVTCDKSRGAGNTL